MALVLGVEQYCRQLLDFVLENCEWSRGHDEIVNKSFRHLALSDSPLPSSASSSSPRPGFARENPS